MHHGCYSSVSRLWSSCSRLRNDKNNNNPHAQVRKLSKRFGMFHGITNLLNLVALACGCVHLCALAGRLGL